MRSATTLVLTVLLASPWLAVAADDTVLECGRIDNDSPPIIDGSLNDLAWQAAIWYDGFTQSVPDLGEPATERTSVAFLHDAGSIYVAVRCDDRSPELLRVNKLRHRDSPQNDDHIQLIFDTYRDQTRGAVFIVNPLGAKEEGLVMGFMQYNWSWKEVWEVRTSITQAGWQAEIRIPLRMLRYRVDTQQEWGVNLRRTIKRKHEDVYLAAPPPPFDISSLNYSVTLSGLHLDSRPRNLQAVPYLLAGVTRSDQPGPGEDDSSSIKELGLDVKYSLSSDLTLDATYNTDFAQVEADNEQVNLTRFSLFYPEKREFFLENAQLFSFGPGDPGGPELIPFFSRRIGLHAGETVPIDVGVRLTGKAGRQDLGFLSVRTAAVDELGLESGFYNVARVRRDLGGRSYLGGIVTDSRRGDLRSSTLGIDGVWFITEPLSLRGYFLTVDENQDREGEEDSNVYHLSLDLTSDPWGFVFGYTQVGRDFAPDLGYVGRRGYRKGDALLRRTIRPGRWGLRAVSFRTINTWFSSIEQGRLESSRMSLNSVIEMERGDFLEITVSRNFERLFASFGLDSDLFFAPGDYSFMTTDWSYKTDSSRRFGGEANLTAGEFYDGDQLRLGASLWYLPSRHLKLSGSYASYDIATSHGDLDWNLWSLRVNYIFSSRMDAASFLQYNSSTGTTVLNLRLHWILRHDSDLYIVFNQRELDDGFLLRNGNPGGMEPGHDLAVKINYRFFL